MTPIADQQSILNLLREQATESDRETIDKLLATSPEPLHTLFAAITTQRDDATALAAKLADLLKMVSNRGLSPVMTEQELESIDAALQEAEAVEPGLFNVCNCGFASVLEREPCGKNGTAFAVRCPDCNKSVQAFTEAGLAVNWNAVSRKNARPLPSGLVTQ